MKKTSLLTAVCAVLISSPVLAGDEIPAKETPMEMDSSKPVHDKEKCEMMSKMKPMKEMKKKHMHTVEERLANIENLLEQLVELHKGKHADH